jgi:hypothetical protein
MVVLRPTPSHRGLMDMLLLRLVSDRQTAWSYQYLQLSETLSHTGLASSRQGLYLQDAAAVYGVVKI